MGHRCGIAGRKRHTLHYFRETNFHIFPATSGSLRGQEITLRCRVNLKNKHDLTAKIGRKAIFVIHVGGFDYG